MKIGVRVEASSGVSSPLYGYGSRAKKPPGGAAPQPAMVGGVAAAARRASSFGAAARSMPLDLRTSTFFLSCSLDMSVKAPMFELFQKLRMTVSDGSSDTA